MAVLFCLAACSSSKSDDDAAKEQQAKETKEQEAKEALKKKKSLPICPQVAIVRELATFRDYGAEKPDLSELVAAARMESVEGDCGYQKGDDKQGIDIAFDLHLIAQRGPRLGGDRNGFPFFIAIIDPDENIVDKNQLTTEFRFSDDLKKIVDKTENLHVFIPVAKDKWDTGPNYRVLVGFQLTQAQLDLIKIREEPKLPGEKTSPDLSAQKMPEKITPDEIMPGPAALAPKTLDQELPSGITPTPPVPEVPAPESKPPESPAPDAPPPDQPAAAQ